MSSTIQMLPSESSWMPSKPPRPERARDVGDGRRVVRRGRVGRCARALRRKEQPPRPRVPGGAVDRRQRLARRVLRREQRHLVRGVGVEVDAGDVARPVRAALVALEEEVLPVVVARVRAAEPVAEHQVGVLVRLGLVRLLGRARRRRNHLRLAGRVDDVVVVAVVGGQRGRVLELGRALRDDDLRQLGRQLARGRIAVRPRVRGRDVGERRPARWRGGADRGGHGAAGHDGTGDRRQDPGFHLGCSFVVRSAGHGARRGSRGP
jgi:hypothetical protein